MLSNDLTFLTVAETAEVIGVTDGRIRQLLRAGDLVGEKFGTQWVVTRGEAERYAKIDPPSVGRPRTKENSETPMNRG